MSVCFEVSECRSLSAGPLGGWVGRPPSRSRFFVSVSSRHLRRTGAHTLMRRYKKSSAGQLHDEMFALLINMLLMTRSRSVVSADYLALALTHSLSQFIHTCPPMPRLTQTPTHPVTRSLNHRGRRLVGWLASNWPRMVMLIMSLNGLERCVYTHSLTHTLTHTHSNTLTHTLFGVCASIDSAAATQGLTASHPGSILWTLKLTRQRRIFSINGP